MDLFTQWEKWRLISYQCKTCFQSTPDRAKERGKMLIYRYSCKDEGKAEAFQHENTHEHNAFWEPCTGNIQWQGSPSSLLMSIHEPMIPGGVDILSVAETINQSSASHIIVSKSLGVQCERREKICTVYYMHQYTVGAVRLSHLSLGIISRTSHPVPTANPNPCPYPCLYPYLYLYPCPLFPTSAAYG